VRRGAAFGAAEDLATVLHRSLEASVSAHAIVRPVAPALLAAPHAPCSYQQLATHLDRLGAALTESLPADNAVIAVAAANGPQLLTAIVATMSRGICAPFDPGRPAAEIDAFLADIRPALVLADEAAIARHRDALDRYGIGVVRMIAPPRAPAGVFEVLAENLHQRRAPSAEYADGVALLLRTSGTTSASKIVPHTMPGLMHIFTSIVDAVNLQPADRCLNARPLHHVHAIAHVIGATLVAGASVAFPAEIGAAALVDGLRTYKATWYSSSPPVHHDVLAYALREATPLEHSLRFIRSSSAPLDPHVAHGLEAALGVPLLEGYGTSEAPAAALNPPPPLVRKPGSAGLPLGCEIAIFDGEVAIRGANVATSYASGERGPIADPSSGWYRTGDAGHLDSDGYLYITGRLNELINVGGEKVAPGNVEAAVRTHLAVADAAAFAIPHPTLGQQVAIAVVARADATVTERDVIEHAAQLLPRAAVPYVVHLVPAIERDGNGKLRGRELLATFARDARAAHVDLQPAQDDTVLLALGRIWEDVLGYAPVALDANFFAAGGDSLRAVRVMTRIEADLGITMSLDALLFAPTIRELARAVRAQANGPQRNRIVVLRATGSRPPLFFYDHDVNSGGLYARFLLAALDSEQPIYVVRPNGTLGDPVPESIDLMADADAVLIATAVPSQTYRLAGFCSGGVIAFEVARRLERAGSTVDVLTLIGSSATNALLDPLWALTSRASGVLSQRGTTVVYKTVRSIANAVRTRSAPSEILNAMYELWHPLAQPTPIERIYSDRLMRHFPKRTARSVDLIWANDDRPRISGDPSMGWRHVARVRRHSVSGNHRTVLTDHVAEVGAVMRRIFDSADLGGNAATSSE
jgi:acyl-CoA synthetase (AMP-forming)/AMP-acid ligase II/thioesterase domain-containing protein/acyl carrier protein